MVKLNKLKDKQDNVFIVTFFLTIITMILICTIINQFKFPIDEEYIKANYMFDISNFYNNKGQTLQYISCLVGFPLFFCLYYYLIKFKNKFKLIRQFKYYNMFMYLLVFIILMASLFRKLDVIMMILVLLPLLIINKKNIFNFFQRKYNKINIVVLIIGIVMSLLYINNNYLNVFFETHHVTAYYYPVHKILNGLTPYIDFNPLYGGYCYIYAFIIHFFPSNTHLIVFSIVTSILVFISLMLTYKFIKTIIKNDIIRLIVFLVTIFLNIGAIYFAEQSTYIQYFPHRYLPIIIMLNYMLYYINNSCVKNEILGFVLCGTLMFWNLDSGLILLVTYISLIIYGIIENRKIGGLLKIPLYLVTSIFIYTVIIEIITCLRTGSFALLNNILFSILLFSNNGFLSLRLKLFEVPWLIVLFIYFFEFGNIILKVIENKSSLNDKVKYMLCILGFGLLYYFIERSVFIKFVYVIVPFALLLGITMDKKMQKKICDFELLLVSCTLVIITFLSISLIFYQIIIKVLSLNKIDSSIENTYQHLMDFKNDVIDFEMIVNCDTIYYELLNKKDIKKLPSYLDLFTMDDLNNVIRYIENSDTNVVVSFELVASHYKKFINETMVNNYEIYYWYDKYSSDSLVFFIKKDEVKNISNLEEYTPIEKMHNL